jgi:glutamyl-tRNA reductase
MGSPDQKTRDIMDDLTRVLAKKILTDATFAVRSSAEEGDIAMAESLVKAITRGQRIENLSPKQGNP